MSQKTVFVGSLPYEFSENEVYELCQEIGDIEKVNVITDRDTGQSKGFAFVTFVKQHDAENAIKELNGKDINGRKIVVNMAKPKAN